MTLSESTVEEATFSWFQELGWNVLHSIDIAPGEPSAERESYQDVILSQRLYDAINLINQDIPSEAL
jgi:type I restriction enzyme R subunit